MLIIFHLSLLTLKFLKDGVAEDIVVRLENLASVDQVDLQDTEEVLEQGKILIQNFNFGNLKFYSILF